VRGARVFALGHRRVNGTPRTAAVFRSLGGAGEPSTRHDAAFAAGRERD
jgi:hypothetical protein